MLLTVARACSSLAQVPQGPRGHETASYTTRMAEANYEPLIQGGDDQGGYDNQARSNPRQDYNDQGQGQGGEGDPQQPTANDGEGQHQQTDGEGNRQPPVRAPPQGRRYDSVLTSGKLFIGCFDPRAPSPDEQLKPPLVSLCGSHAYGSRSPLPPAG